LLALLRYGWPIIVLAILWFPFDWLSTVWPAFGVPFRMVFHNAHDHFIGHTVFFFIVGFLALAYLPRLRRAPHWYLLGLVVAALVQEAIQAFFRGQVPTFTDTNAFKGDALGGISAFLVWGIIVIGSARLAARSASHRPGPPPTAHASDR
jgi:hypothetical protein